MAVVGSTTVQLATQTYNPPFQGVTSTAISYIGGPTLSAGASTTVGSTAATPTNTGPVDPTVPPRGNDHAYIETYLKIHSLSSPSYRYAYFLWFVLIALAILFAIGHNLGLRGGFLGSAWTKRAIRRTVIRSRGAKKRELANPNAPRGRSVIWPSNAQIFSIAIVGALVACLCVIGDDYINPYTSTWNLGSSFAKRAGAVEVYQTPSYNISKTWWTSGARFGLIAFALFPLVVLFALKAPPFAILAIRGFMQIHADKLELLHRWTGRIIWLVTTLHVALWTVQLFINNRGNGENRKVWFVIWIYDKFIWAVVGYAGMTGLVVCSMKWVRQKFYETFYILHIFFTIVTLLGSVMHYPPLWYWIAIAAALWVGERIYRFIRFGRINGWYGGLDRKVETVAGPQFGNQGDNYSKGAEAYGMRDIRPSMHSRESKGTIVPVGGDSYDVYAKPLPRDPVYDDCGSEGSRSGNAYSQDPAWATPQRGSHHSSQRHPSQYEHGYDDGSMRPQSSDMSSTYIGTSYDEHGTPRQGDYLQTARSSSYTHDRKASVAGSDMFDRKIAPQVPATVIPSGYAHAQLLPSKTVRLTVRVPKPFSWAPGQHVLLWVPQISRFQSHPFSILSAWDDEHEVELVLLVKARKGFTLSLFEETRRRVFAAAGVSVGKDKRQSIQSMATLTGQGPPPAVLYRVLVDGPYGSAARGRPGSNHSVLIICGGSGVSFGISVLTYLCECIASRDNRGLGRAGKGGRKFITDRVRFVWIVREFAEIAWVAAMFKRCLDMVSRDVFQLDIYVTDRKHLVDTTTMYDDGLKGEGPLLPPKPKFAQGSDIPRRGSNDSVSSMLSQDQYSENGDRPAGDGNIESATDAILELTNYEDEEDQPESPAQSRLSRMFQKEGKVRRAKSRKRTKGKSSDPPGASSYPPPRKVSQPAMTPSRPPTDYAYVEPESRSVTPQPYAHTPSGSYDQPARMPLNDTFNRHSDYQDPFDPPTLAFGHQPRASIASSMNNSFYGRYDPFAGVHGDGRYSPSPSMTPLDFDSRSIAGESMKPFAARGDMGFRRPSGLLVEGNLDAAGDAVDAGIWLDAADFDATTIVAEMARPGRPNLDAIIEEEVQRSTGGLGVGTCGPASLNAVVRNAVSDNISLRRLAHGDRSGAIRLFSEDYEN